MEHSQLEGGTSWLLAWGFHDVVAFVFAFRKKICACFSVSFFTCFYFLEKCVKFQSKDAATAEAAADTDVWSCGRAPFLSHLFFSDSSSCSASVYSALAVAFVCIIILL